MEDYEDLKSCEPSSEADLPLKGSSNDSHKCLECCSRGMETFRSDQSGQQSCKVLADLL